MLIVKIIDSNTIQKKPRNNDKFSNEMNKISNESTLFFTWNTKRDAVV